MAHKTTKLVQDVDQHTN